MNRKSNDPEAELPALETFAATQLEELPKARLRSLKEIERLEGAQIIRDGRTLISFACNDYLGLSQHPDVQRAAAEATLRYGAGAGASRLVSGNHPLYAELEKKLAGWKGTEAALIYGSGYLANIGVISALMGKGDLILSDKLAHACMLDGAKLSNAKHLRFRHNDLADLERLLTRQRKQFRHCLVMTESIFSMDGDRAPLAEIALLAKRHDAWLLVDGAHALEPEAVKVDLYIGTLSKTLGSYGGYVCASRKVVDLLINQSRSVIFSTGLPPAALGAALAALDILRQSPNIIETPLALTRQFTTALGLREPQSQIVPVILGEDAKTVAISQSLEKEGFYVPAIRPPTVPEGSARLRASFSSVHTSSQVSHIAKVMKQLMD